MKSDQIYGLGLLFTINTLNFSDRLSIAAVLDDISKHFGLEESEGGFLSLCFLFGFMFTAPVFGYLGDKYNRKWILVGGLCFWCAAAASGSIVGPEHKYLFFLSRILVGVGEASYSAIAPTIIADLFGPDTRKLALSIFYFAIPIGSGLGFFIGFLATHLQDWRFILWITPTFGVLCVFLLILLPEPVRGQSENSVGVRKNDATVSESIFYLLSIKSYVYATLGFTCCLFAIGALIWWARTFFQLAVGDSYKKEATYMLGIIVTAAGFVGVAMGSSVAQYWRKFDGRADPFVCALGVFLAVPFTCFGLMAARSATSLSWILLFFSVTLLSTNMAVISDMILSVTLPNKRAFASAMQILVSHLLGDATSPTIIGKMSDYLQTLKGDDGQPLYDRYTSFLYSLETLLIPLTMGAVIFWFCAKYFVEDVEKCRLRILRNRDSSQSEPDSITSSRPDVANLTDFASMP